MSLSDKAYSEKRDFIRMKISAPLTATLSADQRVFEGNCLDLSGGGMRVETNEIIATGTELDVEVSSDHGHNPTLKARTRVVRSISNDKGTYELGLEIVEVLK